MTARAVAVGLLAAAVAAGSEYERRVQAVSRTPGFVALWDFVKREGGRFAAHQPPGGRRDFRLEAVNYVREYWGAGRAATYEDFPLLGRGPFGQAVLFRRESDADFRPCLLVPRERLHDSGLDVKGPGRSVSMVVWLLRESGNHAIAGIWHEGTDLDTPHGAARRVERGRRQYALFAGLAANPGASAAHVSENGASSFGDRYARNLAVTPDVIPEAPSGAAGEALDAAWCVAGFVFDNAADTVTAYLNGKAREHWIENPEKHPFYQWPARAWTQAQLNRIPGLQAGEDPAFPRNQFYEPPEGKPVSRTVLETRGEERVELHRFRFTKVRVTLRKDARGRFRTVMSRELAALRVNPFWFPHDLYAPPTAAEGGPFTIGRVIHSGRNVGFTGYIGAVAVFSRALTPAQMERLSRIGRAKPIPAPQ